MRDAIRRISAAGAFVSAAAIWLAAGAHAQPPKEIAVEVTGASEPVLCAEKDNVTVNLASKDVRRFRIEATHPSYIGSIQRDSFEPDWSGCTAPGDPSPEVRELPRRTTLHEEYELWVVGQTYPVFWRPATAAVRVGDRVAKDAGRLLAPAPACA
jgi:hypothetical protein